MHILGVVKGLASYCEAETTFTFHFSILTLSNASLGINNREIKSESGISFAIASQPLGSFYYQSSPKLPKREENVTSWWKLNKSFWQKIVLNDTERRIPVGLWLLSSCQMYVILGI